MDVDMIQIGFFQIWLNIKPSQKHLIITCILYHQIPKGYNNTKIILLIINPDDDT